MNRLIVSLLCLWICAPFSSVKAQEIPDHLTYCGVQLAFTQGAKNKLSAYVTAIFESPRYYNAMVEMADTYMPFIEEAFQDAGVPDDLKYLVIQESSLKADAISSSNAVGYWQFKEGAAKDYGLRVNKYVDERRHIFRASQAAAAYFLKANYDFDNWVYAVVAFYEGLTGAVIYTDPEYYSKSQMVVTEDLHWYVMKAIAHKIAYQEALEMERQPRIWLEPLAAKGVSSPRVLYEAHGLSEADFLHYNKWILDKEELPEGEVFTYYIPHVNEVYLSHKTDPNKEGGIHGSSVSEADLTQADDQPVDNQANPNNDALASNSNRPSETIPPNDSSTLPNDEAPSDIGESNELPKDTLVVETPPPPRRKPRVRPGTAVDVKTLPDFDYALFPLTSDLEYGEEYVHYDSSLPLPDIAQTHNIRFSRLLEWNGLRAGKFPKNGQIIYLLKSNKRLYHVIAKGQTLSEIASMYKTSIAKLKKLNNMPKSDNLILEGQKLYVKKKKPKGEKIIVLSERGFEEPEEDPAPPVVPPTPPVQVEKRDTTPEVETLQPIDSEVKHTGGDEPPLIPIEVNPGGNLSDQSPQTNNQDSEAGEVPARPDFKNFETKWVEHIVRPGETLWSISVSYGTKVEIIKLTNKLASDDLKEGMSLRILAKVDKLKELGLE